MEPVKSRVDFLIFLFLCVCVWCRSTLNLKKILWYTTL